MQNPNAAVVAIAIAEPVFDAEAQIIPEGLLANAQVDQVGEGGVRFVRANVPQTTSKYAKVNLYPGQRIVDPSSISTTQVSAIIDITGDPVGQHKVLPNFFDNKKVQMGLCAFSAAFVLLPIPLLFFQMGDYYAVLASFGFLIFGFLVCCAAPTPEFSETYMEGRYDKQLKALNKKAVYVQNSNGDVVKYIVRVGPRRQFAKNKITAIRSR